MNGLLRRLGGQAVVYGVIGGLGRFAGLILLPIYTRVLSQEEWGAYALVVSFISFAALLTDLGMASAVMRYTPRQEGPSAQSFGLRVAASAGLVAGVGVFLGSGWLSQALTASSVIEQPLRIGAAFVVLASIANVYRAMLRAEQRQGRFAVLALGRTVVVTGAGAWLVAGRSLGIEGAVTAEVLGSAVPLLLVVPDVVRRLRQRVTPGLGLTLLRYGAPLVPAALFYWVIDQSDRWLLARLADLSEVGLYAAAARLAQIVMIAVWGVQLAWPPFAFAVAEDGDAVAKPLYASVARLYGSTFPILAVALGAYSPLLLELLATDAYSDAAPALAFLTFSAICLGLFYVYSIGAHIGLRTGGIAVIGAVGAAINVALNLMVLPRWGAVGAAATTVTTYWLVSMGMLWHSQRQYRVAYPALRINVVIGVGLSFGLVGSLLEQSPAMNLVARPLLIVATGVVIWAVGLVTVNGLREGIRSLVGALRR